MGTLIKTKGTKKLAAHFNEEFDTWIDWWRALQGANMGTLFDRGAGNPADLLAITNHALAKDTTNAQHSRRTDNKCLLPDIHGHPVHVHLEARWIWFLTIGNAGNGGLQQPNHNAIADAILFGLNDQTQGNPTFDCITFDAVEAGMQLQQSVAVTEHRVDGRTILEITLITPPIPRGSIANNPSPLRD